MRLLVESTENIDPVPFWLRALVVIDDVTIPTTSPTVYPEPWAAILFTVIILDPLVLIFNCNPVPLPVIANVLTTWLVTLAG